MSLISEIKELKERDILIGTLAFLGVIAPGFLTIYHYHPELVEKYDVLKLTIFSCALTMPVFILYAGIAIGVSPAAKLNDEEMREPLILSAFGSFTVLYVCLGAVYLMHLKFGTMIELVIALLIPYFIAVKWDQRTEAIKKMNSKPQEPAAPKQGN